MSTALENCPALVLNADFRPLTYFPLSLWSWQDAVKAVFLDRVNVVSEYDRFIHSPKWDMKLPSVISLKEYVQLSRRPAFTRFNVFFVTSSVVSIVEHDSQPRNSLLITSFLGPVEALRNGQMLSRLARPVIYGRVTNLSERPG